MKKLLALVIALTFLGTSSAPAHQPVDLLKTDTTAAKGPLLVDGTVSFAIRASFTKAGEKKGFRAQLQEGDALNFQYLIMDKKPENALKMTQLPTLVVTGPGGFKTTMKLNERTKFLETFSQTMYLYLGRHSSVAPGRWTNRCRRTGAAPSSCPGCCHCRGSARPRRRQ